MKRPQSKLCAEKYWRSELLLSPFSYYSLQNIYCCTWESSIGNISVKRSVQSSRATPQLFRCDNRSRRGVLRCSFQNWHRGFLSLMHSCQKASTKTSVTGGKALFGQTVRSPTAVSLIWLEKVSKLPAIWHSYILSFKLLTATKAKFLWFAVLSFPCQKSLVSCKCKTNTQAPNMRKRPPQLEQIFLTTLLSKHKPWTEWTNVGTFFFNRSSNRN